MILYTIELGVKRRVRVCLSVGTDTSIPLRLKDLLSVMQPTKIDIRRLQSKHSWWRDIGAIETLSRNWISSVKVTPLTTRSNPGRGKFRERAPILRRSRWSLPAGNTKSMKEAATSRHGPRWKGN